LLTESEIVAADAKPRGDAPDGEDVVRLENVSVEYRVPRERIRSFKEYAIRLLQGRVQHEEFRALNDVSLTVRRGEVFGVIGHNGAGKSTLLKVVSRVMRPTRGRVWVKGRIAPLLELGAGFHPELSGRENIFLNGTLLGHTRAEMEELFDWIVDFAALGDFIDAPLRTYSTGMGVRLGFAVATASRPDILLVDEVLSVGDEQFQEKCAARMTEFRQSGTTILLVTHDTRQALAMCDHALWLDHGAARALGVVDEVIETYHDAHARKPQRTPHYLEHQSNLAPPPLPSLPDDADQDDLAAPAEVAKLSDLEELALQKQWFYSFDLPSGRRTECLFPPEINKIHDTRWAMLYQALEPLCAGDFSRLSCLDLGCNQGYFAVKLARLGCRQVSGVDARAAHIRDAELMRRIWALKHLQFRRLDLWQINPESFGQFDVVSLLGVLYNLENPIGALRLARALARRAVVIETQIAPDLGGQINWGSKDNAQSVHGSFALIDQTGETDLSFAGLTGLSLCPGREALMATMRRLGFTHIEILPPPPYAYEQFVTGHRIFVVGHCDG
jgi:ABC-2 type transport system ATP-binding protein/lipopolysaccharide transport system ATP-binding protein